VMMLGVAKSGKDACWRLEAQRTLTEGSCVGLQRRRAKGFGMLDTDTVCRY